ncbi:hypothetical protein STHU_26030 [Allostella humosa]|nr:hypothetical protein STHU_26030 [Stella humosa]
MAAAILAAGLALGGPALGVMGAAGLPARPAAAAEQPFPVWLDELRREALAGGISPGVLDRALAGLEPNPRVIELDRRQPEGTMTFATYRTRVVARQRIDQGRQLLADNRQLLAAVEQRYGVPAPFIVALWGVETSYGRVTGNFPVVTSLATLAYDGRRAELFRGELINALRILDQGHITADGMLGSWAGAMGQSQFMPSSFLNFAVDYDGDGRRDIWGTRSDVFASIANYLSSSGWTPGGWGREVRVPAGMVLPTSAIAGADDQRPMAEWAARGLVQADGSPLPMDGSTAGLVLPERDGTGPAFLVHPNYRVLLRWNRSTYFALAVSELADRLAQP